MKKCIVDKIKQRVVNEFRQQGYRKIDVAKINKGGEFDFAIAGNWLDIIAVKIKVIQQGREMRVSHKEVRGMLKCVKQGPIEAMILFVMVEGRDLVLYSKMAMTLSLEEESPVIVVDAKDLKYIKTILGVINDN